jgi:hypothetical protein
VRPLILRAKGQPLDQEGRQLPQGQPRALAEVREHLRPEPGVVADRREDPLDDRFGTDGRAGLRVEVGGRRDLEPGVDLPRELRPGGVVGDPSQEVAHARPPARVPVVDELAEQEIGAEHQDSYASLSFARSLRPRERSW